MTVKELVDRFLGAKEEKVEQGERSPRTFADYLSIGKRIADEFGQKRAADDLQSDYFDNLLTSFK